MKTYRLSLAPRSAFITPVQADTVFGSFCWAVRYIDGEDQLDRFLQRYLSDDPPVIFSDGMPGSYLPKPILDPWQSDSSDGWQNSSSGLVRRSSFSEVSRAAKAWKRAAFVSVGLLRRAADDLSERRIMDLLLAGEACASGPLVCCRAETDCNMEPGTCLHDTGGERPCPLSQLARRTTVEYRNAIDRMTGDALDGALFAQEMTWHSTDVKIVTYVRFQEDIDPDWVLRMIRFIEVSGFGKGKSIGKGHFTIGAFEEAATDELVFSEKPNAFMSLSSFIPSPADPTDGWYGLNIKRGRLGGSFASANIAPWKRPLRMLSAGSVLKTEDLLPYYGTIVRDVYPRDRRVVHYAYAFPVGVKV